MFMIIRSAFMFETLEHLNFGFVSDFGFRIFATAFHLTLLILNLFRVLIAAPMDPIEAIILGIIQGLTEFLPVSSSGHLVLFQQLFGLKEAELFFDVCVHLGTLVAVIVVFHREIQNIIAALLRIVS